jgi:hypothetical protein
LKVHLVDGTYELFRHYFAVPKARDARGREVGAVRRVLASLLAMMRAAVSRTLVSQLTMLSNRFATISGQVTRPVKGSNLTYFRSFPSSKKFLGSVAIEGVCYSLH